MSLFPYFNAGVNKRRRSSIGSSGLWLLAAVMVVVLIVGGVMVGSAYGKHHSVTTTINSKERVCDGGNSGCKYLVYTDHGTYKITDSFFIGTTRFNSSDVYGRIHPCDRYRIEYYGWRLPFFSSYPNIAKATDLGPVAGCRPS